MTFIVLKHITSYIHTSTYILSESEYVYTCIHTYIQVRTHSKHHNNEKYVHTVSMNTRMYVCMYV